MKYYIGMDGGGTKTHCTLINDQKEILFECSGGPANFLMIGTETVSETIAGLIRKCKEETNIHFNQIDHILIGATGAGRRNDAQTLEQDFRQYCVKTNLFVKNFTVESDALVALEGAFGGNPGSILIAGTGSIMYGKDAKDKLFRVGGFGRFIGDEGSGYSIGKKGLIAVARHLDGRGIPTLLTQLAGKDFQMHTMEDVITSIYKNNFDIASFAPVVLLAAEQGDKAATDILESESEELIQHISAMQKKIPVQNLDVSFIGSLIVNDNIYSRLLRRKIKETLKNINIKTAQYSPSMGAALLALKKMSGN